MLTRQRSVCRTSPSSSSSSSSSFSLLLFFVSFLFFMSTTFAKDANIVSCRDVDFLEDNFPTELYDACSDYLDSTDNGSTRRVYVDATFKSRSSEIYQALNGFKLLPNRCRDSALRFYCPLFFLTCRYTPMASTVPWPRIYPVPVLPCSSLCESMMDSCEKDFKKNGIPSINCTTFPRKRMEIEQLGFSAPCYDDTKDMNFKDFLCPLPLVYTNPDFTVNGACSKIKCPDPTYDDIRASIVWIYQILHTISAVCALFLIIPYIAIPSRRYFPHLQLTQTFLANLFYVLPGIALWSRNRLDFICNGDVSAEQENNAGCAFFGFWFAWHSMALTTWWLNLIINLFFGVVLERLIPLWGFYIMFVIAWFGSCFLASTVLVAGKYTSGGIAYCFIDVEWSAWIYFLPLTIVYVTAIALLIPVILKMTTILRWAKKNAGTSVKSTRMRQHLRILIFAAYYLIAIGFSIAFGWYIYIERDAVAGGYADYVTCSVTELGSPKCANTNPLPSVLLYFTYILTGIGAIVLWLVFGVGHSLIWFWWKTLFITRRWPNSYEVEKEATRAQSMGQNKSSGGTGTGTGSSSKTSSKFDTSASL